MALVLVLAICREFVVSAAQANAWSMHARVACMHVLRDRQKRSKQQHAAMRIHEIDIYA